MNKVGIVKNPLSVIAIFAGVAEISGTGVLPFVSPENQELYIWFLMTFPFTLIILFFATLNWNHKVLYAPSDYQSDDSFLEGIRASSSTRDEIISFEQTLDSNIDAAISTTTIDDIGTQEGRNRVAQSIKESIRKSAFISIDTRPLLGDEGQLYELPFVAFSSVGDLTNQIYFLINDYVRPFEYGHTWVMKDAKSGQTIKNSRIITGAERGVPCPDKRGLKEAGIEPGSTIHVTRP